MRVRSWKHQWLPLCLAKLVRTKRSVEMVNPIKSNQNLRVSWKPVNPQDCVCKNLYQINMRTKLHERETIHCNITIKLCDENGYSYEWINGQKPHLIKNGIRIICNTENFVPSVVPGLSSSSSGSSSTSRTPMRQESHSSSSSSSSPSSPTVGDLSVREREDVTNSDISPVPVSELVDDRTEEPVETQANEIPKTSKKETTIERGNLCDDPEIPEWLQEFRENLVDDEIPLQGGSHASSSHEASLEPTTKRREDLGKRNVHTHFPKDRNCEICKRTKITRARAEYAMAKPYLEL